MGSRSANARERRGIAFVTIALLAACAAEAALLNTRYFGFDQVRNKVLEVDERGNLTYWAYDQADRYRIVQGAAT